jgi:NAD(P)-dependent dehydrogenase (short-subunit alcohol dehydrogenase family)/putative sterol carrier protein
LQSPTQVVTMLNTGRLAGKVLYISGASRGIGLEFAKKAARDGAKVAIAAKTAEPHPKLPGTIYTAAKEIEALGGTALPLIVDVRNEADVQKSVEDTVRQLGGIDILINNASAISLTGTQETPMKTYDLMHSINTRGTYLVSKCCLPYLKESATKGRNPHILNNSPPLSLKPVWFKNHVAYTMAKYGMSMCVLGMAEEFREAGIAVNAIWPKTAIMTAAMVMMGGGDGISAQCRKPEIMADAAYVILTRHSREFTGNFCVDEHILREVGVTDFSPYLAPGATEDSLMPDFFLDEFLLAQGGEEEAEDIVARVVENPAIKKAADPAAAPAGGQIEAVFAQITSALSEDLVKKTNAVYAFTVTDQGTDWFLDLKNGAGSCGPGPSPTTVDASFKMSSANFGKMFAGKLKPTAAFMTGRLKIEGNMGKAMKLEKLMGAMQKRSYSTVGNAKL